MLSDLAWSAITAVAALAVIAFPIATIAAVGLEIAGRRRPSVIAAAVLLMAWIVGFALLTSENALGIRVVSIAIVLVVLGILSLNGRLGLAGWALILAALPWTVYAGADLVEATIASRRIDLAQVLPPLLTGIIAILLGFALIRFESGYRARHPEATATRAAAADPSALPRAWDAASRAAIGPSLFGMNVPAAASIVAMLVASQATVVAAHGRPVLEVLAIVGGGSIVSGVAGVLVWAVAWPPRSRRSFEAFAWLGESDLERFRALTDGHLTPTLDNMKRHVRNNAERPEDRWIRVEVLAAIGELDAARAVAERLPDDTPVARAERATYVGYLDWLAGGPGDVGELRAAIEAIEPADGDDRLRGEVSLAIAEVRRRIAAGDEDPAAALRDVRMRLGRRATWVLFAAARRLLPAYLKSATVLVVLITLLDLALSL